MNKQRKRNKSMRAHAKRNSKEFSVARRNTVVTQWNISMPEGRLYSAGTLRSRVHTPKCHKYLLSGERIWLFSERAQTPIPLSAPPRPLQRSSHENCTARSRFRFFSSPWRVESSSLCIYTYVDVFLPHLGTCNYHF